MSRDKKLDGSVFGLVIAIICGFGILHYSSKLGVFMDSASDTSRIFIDSGTKEFVPATYYYVRCSFSDTFFDDVRVYISETHYSSAWSGPSWTKEEYSFVVPLSKYESAMKTAFGSNWRAYEATHIYQDVESYPDSEFLDSDHGSMVASLAYNLKKGQDLIAKVTDGPDERW